MFLGALRIFAMRQSWRVGRALHARRGGQRTARPTLPRHHWRMKDFLIFLLTNCAYMLTWHSEYGTANRGGRDRAGPEQQLPAGSLNVTNTNRNTNQFAASVAILVTAALHRSTLPAFSLHACRGKRVGESGLLIEAARPPETCQKPPLPGPLPHKFVGEREKRRKATREEFCLTPPKCKSPKSQP